MVSGVDFPSNQSIDSTTGVFNSIPGYHCGRAVLMPFPQVIVVDVLAQ